MQLVSKISNLCDPDPPTSQTDRRTDGQHAISIPRYALVHRAVKIVTKHGNSTRSGTGATVLVKYTHTESFLRKKVRLLFSSFLFNVVISERIASERET